MRASWLSKIKHTIVGTALLAVGGARAQPTAAPQNGNNGNNGGQGGGAGNAAQPGAASLSSALSVQKAGQDSGFTASSSALAVRP